MIRTNTKENTIQNEDIQTFGRLLRTKAKESNEGGVNAGFAVIDSPYLVEIENIQSNVIQPTVSNF